jgi:MATE family multidrug resistance protein
MTESTGSAPRGEARALLRIGLPLTAAYIAEMGMVITDMVIVGRLGSDELAAVGLAGDLFWIFLMIGMGALSLVGVLAAQARGAGDAARVIRTGEQGMVAALITSLPIMLLVAYLGPLLTLARQDGNVVRLVDEYASILLWAVPPALWFAALRNYCTALSASAAIGWITAAGLALNAALNYWFVYGGLGLPGLGVAGAGLGTTLVNWCMFIALGLHLRRAEVFATHRIRWWPRTLDRRLLSELFRLGIPAALTQVVYGGVFSAAAVAAGAISAATLAAQQVVYSIIYLAASGAWALADALRVRVAFGMGRGSVDAVRRSTATAFRLAMATLLIPALLLWLAPGELVSLFLGSENRDNQRVLAIAGNMGLYAGLFLVLDGAQLMFANALRGLRDTRTPLYTSLVGYWLAGFAPGMLLAFTFGLGADGIWLGLIAGAAIAGLLLQRAFRRRLDTLERCR